MTTTIPAARPLIGDEERAAVDRVSAAGNLAQGPEVAAFEEEFSAELVDGRACVAVNSGTAGAHLGLVAAGIGPGDEVIVPSFTFAATANAVALAGRDTGLRRHRAEPLLPRCCGGGFGYHPADCGDHARPPLRAPSCYGRPRPLLPTQHGLAIFEDAAQAHGARLDGRLVGTFGTFAMFSLYPTKNMTSGEGGMDSCDRRAACPPSPPPAQPRHGASLRERGGRLQRADD